MNALIFIVLRTLKNHIKDIFRRKGKLVLWILILAAIVGFFLLSVFNRAATDENIVDLIWLKGIIFALFIMYMVMAVQKGLSRGDMIFSMSDVNLLFVSPIDARRILLYGIVQMAKMAVLGGFFILFQGNSIGANFNTGYGAVLLVFLGYFLCVSIMQIVSLIIYSSTNGRPRRKMYVRVITVLVFAPIVIAFSLNFINTGNPMQSLEMLINSPIFSWTPIAGWAAHGTIAFIGGDLGTGFLFYGLLIASGAALVLYVMKSNPDYYEDVLVATETAFEKQRAASEGSVSNMSFEAMSERRVKVAKTGVGGLGASALLSKHVRESFRSGRLALWGTPSLVILAGVILYSFMLRETGILSVMGTLMIMQVFRIGMGRGMLELYNHYIYLIPASSFTKMMWSNAETMLKNFVESIAFFTAAGLVMGESVFVIIMCVPVYTLFTLLLLGYQLMSMRFTGGGISQGLEIMIYMIAIVIVVAPGLAATWIIAAAVEGVLGIVLGLAALAVWEIAVGSSLIAAARGVLHNCDMPVVKPKG